MCDDVNKIVWLSGERAEQELDTALFEMSEELSELSSRQPEVAFELGQIVGQLTCARVRFQSAIEARRSRMPSPAGHPKKRGRPAKAGTKTPPALPASSEPEKGV